MNRRKTRFRFIDLFAGIGGIRLAFEEAGGQCIMTSEWDSKARTTYRAFFPESKEAPGHYDNEDITEAPIGDIPDHEILVGGFPCQPFSLAGVSKKNALGRPHGFNDPTQGTLFFNIKEILRKKRPKAFLLENVKNLLSHDKGRTWRVISESLGDVGYVFDKKVLDAKLVVPQHRERTFILGFQRDIYGLDEEAYDWTNFWSTVTDQIRIQAEKQRREYRVPKDQPWPLVRHILQNPKNVDAKYILTPRLWEYLKKYKDKHRALGHGFGFGLIRNDTEYTRTISARYYKDGSEVLIHRGDKERPRRLTPLECARLQGFPERCQRFFGGELVQPVSDSAAYKQFGNSVCVPLVTAIAGVLAEHMLDGGRVRKMATRPQQVSLTLTG